MIELAVLDMAGTTVDDGGAVYTALLECVTGAGADVDAALLQRWMGTDKRAAIRALLPGDPSDGAVESAYADFSARLAVAYAQTPPVPFPGVEEAWATLRAAGVAVALTTGFARDVADPLLAHLGWGPEVVDAVVCADDVPAGRPAPFMVHRAMALTGTGSVARVLVAGDTVVDLQSGVNAGAAMVVGVLTGQLSADELGRQRHTHLLPSVALLPQLLGLC